MPAATSSRIDSHSHFPVLAILEPFYFYWARLGALGGTLFPRLALNSTALSYLRLWAWPTCVSSLRLPPPCPSPSRIQRPMAPSWLLGAASAGTRLTRQHIAHHRDVFDTALPDLAPSETGTEQHSISHAIRSIYPPRITLPVSPLARRDMLKSFPPTRLQLV